MCVPVLAGSLVEPQSYHLAADIGGEADPDVDGTGIGRARHRWRRPVVPDRAGTHARRGRGLRRREGERYGVGRASPDGSVADTVSLYFVPRTSAVDGVIVTDVPVASTDTVPLMAVPPASVMVTTTDFGSTASLNVAEGATVTGTLVGPKGIARHHRRRCRADRPRGVENRIDPVVGAAEAVARGDVPAP